MSAQASDLSDGVLAKLVDDRCAEWEADLPLGDDAPLSDSLICLDQGSRLSFAAHCLSFGISTLHEKVTPYGAGISASSLTKRIIQSDLIAQATGLDRGEADWESTADTYLNGVPKGPDPQGRALGERGGYGAAPRSPEEGRDGDRGRMPAEGQWLVA